MRLFLGAVFLYAGSVKILQPGAFAEAVYSYQILPGAAVNLAAITLPWVEVTIGLCLTAGLCLPGAVLLSTSLLGVFIGALVFNLIRGLDVHCGCFSAEITHGPVHMLTIARDLLFLAISIYMAVFVFLKGGHSRS
ncbi:MAG: MauE/DoxX family redox-associated membrane protein [Desulfatiglandaceae bacterium]